MKSKLLFGICLVYFIDLNIGKVESVINANDYSNSLDKKAN